MKETKITAPIKLLLSICDKGKGKLVEEYLETKKITTGLMFIAKGTAESDMADLFGFGMSDRDVVMCLVPAEESEKIVRKVSDITGIETDNYGLAMLLDINSASTTILEQCGINM